MSKTRTFITTLGLSVVILTAACVLVASASAQTGGTANQIVIRSQDTSTGQIVVDTVIAAQDGWLVVYSDTTWSAASAIGWVPVRKGVNTNLKVNISAEIAEPLATLWAVLHVDRDVFGLLELPTIDGPVQENGKMVMVTFGTQAPPAVIVTPQAQVTAPSVQVAAPGAPRVSPRTLPPAGVSGPPMAWLALIVLGGIVLLTGVMMFKGVVR